MHFHNVQKHPSQLVQCTLSTLIPFTQLQTRGRGVAGFGGVGGSPVKHKHPKSQTPEALEPMEPGSTASGKMWANGGSQNLDGEATKQRSHISGTDAGDMRF